MAKYLFVDTETTGTNPKVNGVIQIGGFIVDDEVLREESEHLSEFNIKANAIGAGCEVATWEDYKTKKMMTPSDVHGISDEESQTYPEYMDSFNDLIAVFAKHVDKFNKKDKLIPVGYNIKFDTDMLEGMAWKCNYKFFRSYVSHSGIDVMHLARAADAFGVLPEKPKDHKLETMCKLFDIQIDAHDALADITATAELMFVLRECLKDV